VVVEERRIIITGGPGAGKSSLLEALRLKGYACQAEAARRVIQQYYSQNCTPWGDRQSFICHVGAQIEKDLQEPLNGLTFYDRGMLDCIAYAREANLPVPEALQQFDPFAYYHRQVFILPPWPQIYRKEPARQQEFSEAVLLYHSIVSTYQAYGFRLIEVPQLALEERVGFVLRCLNNLCSA
jgi:predicted ATPase